MNHLYQFDGPEISKKGIFYDEPYQGLPKSALKAEKVSQKDYSDIEKHEYEGLPRPEQPKLKGYQPISPSILEEYMGLPVDLYQIDGPEISKKRLTYQEPPKSQKDYSDIEKYEYGGLPQPEQPKLKGHQPISPSILEEYMGLPVEPMEDTKTDYGYLPSKEIKIKKDDQIIHQKSQTFTSNSTLLYKLMTYPKGSPYMFDFVDAEEDPYGGISRINTILAKKNFENK